MSTLKNGFYSFPRLHDLLQGAETAAQALFLERLHAAHGNGGQAWLEPACGTGRLVEFLAARGWRVTGYDLEPRMLSYARRRMRHTPGAFALRGDLREFRLPAAFDFAYCLDASFRHLLTDDEALAHLRATADSLRPGGVYAIGMDLTDYDAPEPDEETWTARDGRYAVRQVQMTLPPDRAGRVERMLQFVSRGKTLHRFEYDLRSYDHGEWRDLLSRSPFELAAVYDLFGAPAALDAATRAATFILRRV